MFLFNKKTRNVIKYMWAGFATIIILTMIVAYSGFTSLAGTAPAQEPIEIPAEVREQLRAQQMGEELRNIGTTPEEQQVLDAINDGRIDLGEGATASGTPQTPPEQEFKLEI